MPQPATQAKTTPPTNPTMNRFNLPLQTRTATLEDLRSGDERTFNVVFTTGAIVRRYNFFTDEAYDEELVVDPSDILYELLLKSGFPLTTKVEKLNIAGKEVYSIEEGALLICLEKELTQALIDALAETNPLQVICLDEGFKGNDQLKANAVQTFKARAQAEESEIVFKTV